MADFPFVGYSSPVGNLAASPQRTINFYPEMSNNNKEEVILLGTPGYSLWSDVGNGPVRAGIKFKDNLIVVSHKGVWKVNPGGAPKLIGNINTQRGRVSMAESGAECIIVDGQDGWIYNGSSLTKITDTTFVDTKADSVIATDGYFIVNKKDDRSFWVSGSYDGFTWSGLDTAAAEYMTDNILQIGIVNLPFFLGSESTEYWYNDGTTFPPYSPLRNSRMPYGIAAPQSLVIANNSATWLSQETTGGVKVLRATGPSPKFLSTPAWEAEWSDYPDISDAFAYGINWQGHDWYVLTFPKADHGKGRTFIHDSGGWFEWGNYESVIGDYVKHPMTFHIWFAGKHIIGDADGDLHHLQSGVYTNNGTAIISERRCGVIHEDRKRHAYRVFEVDTGKGVGGDILMNHSDDGGRSWNNWRIRSLGAKGKLKNRARIFKLGSAYDKAFAIRISDEVPRTILSANVR